MIYLILLVISILAWWIISSIKFRDENDSYYNRDFNKTLKKVRKIYPPSMICFWIVILLTCFYQVNPGEVGVVVNMLGDEKGVESQEKMVGIHFIPPWKTVHIFPIFEQNHQWTGKEAFTFQTSEGLPVNAEIGITYHLMPDRIHELFARYRRGMEEITHLFIRNNLRDYINRYASKMKIEDLIGPKKEDFFKDVLESVQKELEDLGFIVTHVYTIGQFDVPQNVKEALNDKIAATQRAQQRENELREAEAQARKVIAETEGSAKSKLIKARAEAEANNLLSKSITPELLQWNSINKWDGKMPYAMSGQGMPFILPLPQGDKK
jgi:regulator of protease activity HflC (stomatin/prohibitin superfamily)